MRNLTIILRTCGRIFAAHGTRYVQKTKPEIINVCASSLINSINQVTNHNIKLFVLDDHSDSDCVDDIKKIISKCKYPTEFIDSTVSGNGPTMGEVYKLVEREASDLWYHVEDDYIHKPEAIQDMIDSVDQFEGNTGQMVAINPHDDVWRYTQSIYESYILLGPYRHYRTVRHTTYTCLASKGIYNKYRNHFQDVVSLTTKKAPWVEDQSINMVWHKPDVMLFSPIPGLAFHIMEESGKDPYLNFDKLWDDTPKLWL
jgi:glycosyltransferase involved in cell wall biosynthesis